MTVARPKRWDGILVDDMNIPTDRILTGKLARPELECACCTNSCFRFCVNKLVKAPEGVILDGRSHSAFRK